MHSNFRNNEFSEQTWDDDDASYANHPPILIPSVLGSEKKRNDIESKRTNASTKDKIHSENQWKKVSKKENKKTKRE